MGNSFRKAFDRLFRNREMRVGGCTANAMQSSAAPHHSGITWFKAQRFLPCRSSCLDWMQRARQPFFTSCTLGRFSALCPPLVGHPRGLDRATHKRPLQLPICKPHASRRCLAPLAATPAAHGPQPECCPTRTLWRHYFNNTDGLIYVVDSCDRERVMKAASEFKVKPWLVMSLKQQGNLGSLGS